MGGSQIPRRLVVSSTIRLMLEGKGGNSSLTFPRPCLTQKGQGAQLCPVDQGVTGRVSKELKILALVTVDRLK